MKRGRSDVSDPPSRTAMVSRGALADTTNRGKGKIPGASSAPPAPNTFAGRQAARRAEEAKKQLEKQKQAREELRQQWLQLIEQLTAEEAYYSQLLQSEQSIQQELEEAIEVQLDDHDCRAKRLHAESQAALGKLSEQIDTLNHTRHTLRDELECNSLNKDRTEEACLLATVDQQECLEAIQRTQTETEGLRVVLSDRKQEEETARSGLVDARAEEEMKQSATYGVSAEVADIVMRTEAAEKFMNELDFKGREIEIERRSKFNRYQELKGTIRVYCRVKGGDCTSKVNCPQPGGPRATGSSRSRGSNPEGDGPQPIEVTQTRANATSTGIKETTIPFAFDRVYSNQSPQGDVFGDVGPLVDCAVDGYKVCILAYGQTGSGKTYTMEGPNIENEDAGIIPRSIDKVFQRANNLRAEGWKYKMTCFFVEIYNDTIRDLLESSDAYHRAYAEGKDLKDRHEIQHKGRVDTVITNVKERTVKCPADVHRLLQVAIGNRSVAKTFMNERSSRSHCVFTMRIEGVNESISQHSVGTLCLVDLAGSERVSESGAQGQVFKEAVAINRSLSSLGDCINALGSNSLPSWRANKLTYLLQNYLGGEGAKMLMIVTLSNKEEHVNESINSLRFASKVNSTHIGVAKKRVTHT